MAHEIVNQAITAFFYVLATGVLAVLGAAFKTYFDVRILKRDMNAAHKKIRELEKQKECNSGNINPKP